MQSVNQHPRILQFVAQREELKRSFAGIPGYEPKFKFQTFRLHSNNIPTTIDYVPYSAD
jgi:hypothetical protein